MIYLRLSIKNLYMFEDTLIDFTYPKKSANSNIEKEYLEEFPNIKFKRVCILMGANASGKTTLGRLMCSINNYLQGRQFIRPEGIITNPEQTASIEVVYVTPNNGTIHQLNIEFNSEEVVFEAYRSIPLRKSKNLDKTFLDLASSVPVSEFDATVINQQGIERPGLSSFASILGFKLDEEDNTAWNYLYSDYKESSRSLEHDSVEMLEAILKAFDNSILSVKLIEDATKAYIIKFSNGDDVIIQDGVISNHDRLSRGTIESIQVANFINAIDQAKQKSGTFFLDEKMAYSHTEVEMAIVNLMIEKLSPCSQLLYTTHNYDILDMNLPTHSYVFMKKGNDGVSVLHPEKIGFNKNDRSLLGYVKNDVFGTTPSTSKIDEML